MKQYKTGSYIMGTRKIWTCEACLKDILIGTNCFVRIKEFGDKKINQQGEKYKDKTYKRWHIDCAKSLNTLNEYELNLLESSIYNHI